MADDVFESFKKELGKVPDSVLPMGQMMRYMAEGYNESRERKRLFASQSLFVPEELDKQQSQSRSRLSRLSPDLAMDSAMRERASKTGMWAISEEDLERENNFREKEKCYDEKESDQEKAAIQRNEQFSGVDTADLMDEAEDLKQMLSEAIDMTDSYALGEREYQRQYLAVIEDLIKTRASKGKIFGNYKSHIALAEEKYLFYKRESVRIIGREQAKIIMNSAEFKTEVKKDEGKTPQLDGIGGLYDKDSFKDVECQPADKKTVLRAMTEYNLCMEKGEYLRRHIAALKAVEKAEVDRRNAPIMQLNKSEKEGFLVQKQKSSANLYDYIQSLENELSAWTFQAKACYLCINFLRHRTLEKGEKNDKTITYAPFIKEHFGVDVLEEHWYNPGERLRDSNMCSAMGFQTGAMDIASGITDKKRKKGALDLFDKEWKDWEESDLATGYEKQGYYEESAVLANSYEVILALYKKENAKSPAAKRKLSTICRDMMMLTQPLPTIEKVYDEQTRFMYDSLRFVGTRDQDGKFVSDSQQKTPDQIADEIRAHVHNMAIIGDKNADAEASKEAIVSMLPMVKEAFDDIDAFMNIGATRNIFTAKNHYQVFDNTAGMPTFEGKARQLRNLISTMLKRKEVLDTVAKETGEENLRQNLIRKWMYLNRALSFVDYRKQLMDKGYNSTMEEWSKDTTFVEGFFEKNEYPPLVSVQDTSIFVTKAKAGQGGAPLDDKGQKEEPAKEKVEEDDEEKAVVKKSQEEKPQEDADDAEGEEEENPQEQKVDILDIPVEGEEESWTEDEKKTWRRWMAPINQARQEATRKYISKEAALEGLSKMERKYVRMDYYESRRFSTPEDRREVIEKDLLKGTSHSAYVSQLTAINHELFQVQRQLREHPSKPLRDRHKELMDQQDSIVQILNIISDTVTETADKILQCLTPETGSTEDVERTLQTLAQKINAPLADHSMDETLRSDYLTKLQNVMRMVVNPQGPDPISDVETKLDEMLDAISGQFKQAALAFINQAIHDLREMAPALNKWEGEPLLEAMDALDKRLADPKLEEERIAAMVAELKSMLTKNNLRLEVPSIVEVRNLTKGAHNYLQDLKADAHKKKKVSFSDEVELVEGDIGKGYKSRKALAKEMDAVTRSAKEQHDIRENEVDPEILAVIKRQRSHLVTAVSFIDKERKDYQKKIADKTTEPIKNIRGADALDDDDKQLIADFVSMDIPMEDTKNPNHVMFADDASRDLVLWHYSNILQSVKKADTDPAEGKRGLDMLLPVISRTYDQLKSYTGKEPGSKILASRKNANFWRLPTDPQEPDNYADDIDGMAILRIKAEQLRKITTLAIVTMTKLSPTYKEYEERKAALMSDLKKIDGLIDFLNWREGIMRELLKIIPDKTGKVETVTKMQYSWDVMHNPENWYREKPASL